MQYPGGKNGAGVYQKIINHLPPHNIFIEGFLGSGSIIRHKKPAEINIGIEIDQSVIAANNYGAGIDIVNMDALEYLKNMTAVQLFTTIRSKRILIYLDPPYKRSTRSSSKDIYAYELTDKDHADLLQLIIAMPAGDINIAISHYENDLYNYHLKNWNRIKYMTVTRAGKPREETLYFNYDFPKQLHDYSYLGDDFIQRQQIKRKIKRHVNRLKTLPELERNAILESFKILNPDNYPLWIDKGQFQLL